MMGRTPILIAAAGLLFVFLTGCTCTKPGTVLDEAKQAQLEAKDFPAANEDYFHDMDGGITQNPPAGMDRAAWEAQRVSWIKGRNTWIVWTGGNDRFWDKI